MPSDACSVALAGWNPGSEAEPSGVEDLAQQDEAAAAPTVLGKLQKWADYDAVGLPVAPTMFIPMKTPMSTEILDNWSLAEEPKHPLTVPLLLAREAALGREVGMIIDLANHDCLYSDDMPDSLEYAHVQLIAKQLPCREAINEVEREAKGFWDKHPDKYIALHCAYGFNRTGFVICSYLCQACGLSVEQALDSFAAARPPGVKHEKFIRELHARYGGGAAVTPDGSVLDGSAPVVAAVEDLAAEAERLRQWAVASEAATARGKAAAGVANGPTGQQQQGQQQRQGQQQQQRQQLGRGREPGSVEQQQQRQQHEHAMDDANEDVPHFEDAADLIRRESDVRRTGSLSRANTGGSADNLPAVPSALAQHPFVSKSGTPSQPGSSGSSRNASRHGGNHFDPAQASSTEAAAAFATAAAGGVVGAGVVNEGNTATVGANAPPEGFAASRRLMQRKLPRGGGSSGSGGLSLALAASEGMHRPSGGSPDSSGSGAMGGSPESGDLAAHGRPTAHSSVSDFASAANYLEEGASSWRRDSGGAGSMRRSTSLGLAKALSEDFLQNNGTPSTVAPITAAAERDEGALLGQGPAACPGQPGSVPPEHAAAAAASQQRCDAHGSSAGSAAANADGPSSSGTRDGVSGGGGDGSAWVSSSPPKPGMQPSFSGPFSSSPTPLTSSPSKRGGIPQPPGSRPQLVVCAMLPAVRSGPSLLSPEQQQQQQQPQQVIVPQQLLAQQPGTPATPASSGGAGTLPAVCSGLQQQSSASGFPRSMSIDSENPSLGFNMREALAQLRLGAAGGDPAAHRGPQALADLFSQDSGFEHAALDVEEHLQALAMAQAAGLDSPAASAHLPSVIEVASSAEAGSCSPGSGSLLHYMRPPAGRAAAPQGASGQPSPAATHAAASPAVAGSPASQGTALSADASRSSGSSSPGRRARCKQRDGSGKGRCRLM